MIFDGIKLFFSSIGSGTSVMQTIWQRRSDTEKSDQIQRCALNKDISPATRGREATARIRTDAARP